MLVVFTNAQAQILNPVKWKPHIEKKSNSEYVLTLQGEIEPNWHVYSQFTPEDGPLPTQLIFHNKQGNYEVVGKATESETRREFNDIFGVDEVFFKDQVTFKQSIKNSNTENEVIQLELFYQVCEESCISETKYFEFNLKTLEAKE